MCLGSGPGPGPGPDQGGGCGCRCGIHVIECDRRTSGLGLAWRWRELQKLILTTRADVIGARKTTLAGAQAEAHNMPILERDFMSQNATDRQSALGSGLPIKRRGKGEFFLSRLGVPHFRSRLARCANLGLP